MRQGWRAYFQAVAQYQIHADEFFHTDERLAISSAPGRVESTQRTARPTPDNFWEVPAAWRVVISDGLVAEWRVYADNQPLRKLMGERQP